MTAPGAPRPRPLRRIPWTRRRAARPVPHPEGAARLVIVGGRCPVGEALHEEAERRGSAVDVVESESMPSLIPGRQGASELTLADGGAVSAAIRRADALVLIAATGRGDGDGSGRGALDIELARGCLELAPPALPVIALSTAFVYGAQAGAPFPCTETAPLRPSAALAAATTAAELEALVGAGGSPAPARRVVLRPPLVVCPGSQRWWARSVWAPARLRPGGPTPGQYLHVADLVESILHACDSDVDGVFNVAPDGWIDEISRAELADRRVAIRVPARVWRLWWTLRSWVGLSTTPTGVLEYAARPLAVANDRWTATGWSPHHSNEEAFLIAHRPGWWAALPARQRQDVALGGALAGAAGLVAGGAWLLRSAVRGVLSGGSAADESVGGG